MQNRETMKNTMDKFCSISGQKVHLEKPQVVFSKNLSITTANTMSSLLGLKKVDKLDSYLGFSTNMSNKDRNSFNFHSGQDQEKIIRMENETAIYVQQECPN